MPGGSLHYNRKMAQVRAERRHAKISAELNPHTTRPAQRTKAGTVKTNSDTTIDQITLRQQSTLRNKKIKPSMPKMPWD